MAVDHWSNDPLLRRRALVGVVLTVGVLWRTPPLWVLLTVALVCWPLGALEASSAWRIRRSHDEAEVRS